MSDGSADNIFLSENQHSEFKNLDPSRLLSQSWFQSLLAYLIYNLFPFQRLSGGSLPLGTKMEESLYE